MVNDLRMTLLKLHNNHTYKDEFIMLRNNYTKTDLLERNHM